MPDVIVVGGAANGWATAYYLKRTDPSIEVTVVEKDPGLSHSSTMLSDGNVRIQFNLPENIAMSLYALEVLDTFESDMAVGSYRPDPVVRKQGNLFFIDESERDDALASVAFQQHMGCRTEWLDTDEIVRRWPALKAEAEVVGGTFGPDDGSVDSTAVVEGYRRKGLEAGVKQVESEVATLTATDGRIEAVTLTDGGVHRADNVVVCAGAWSTDLLASAGVEIPVDPVMRTVFVVAADLPGPADLPSVFLGSGVYAIPESDGTFLMGWSTEADPVGFDFTPAPRSRFYDHLWPALVSVLPAFDRLDVVRSWAGLYAQNTLDANGIIGEWPTIDGLYMATGFSGHGFQQCHAVGRHLAELICGRQPSIDLSRLSPQRIISGEPLYEHARRII